MIKDYKMDPAGSASRHHVDFPIATTAVSQTGLLAGAWTPTGRYQVVKVSVFATAVTATITCDVQIAGTSVLTGAITPVAGSEVVGTLTSTLANLRGTASQQLQAKYTSNGTGAATNLTVRVQLRPYPCAGESN